MVDGQLDNERPFIMITLPDFNKCWDYENRFYSTCDPSRISKFIAHYELFKMTLNIPGELVECGVFKGISLLRFAMFRKLLATEISKKIIGFDAFGPFPETEFEDDKEFREHFINDIGGESIATQQLEILLEHKKCDDNVELIAGNICNTVPEYIKKKPQLKISFLNLDTDIYEPTVTVLEHLYPRIVAGGVLLLDDYGLVPGETTAVDNYFKDKGCKINKLPFCERPCYIIKQ